MTDVPSPTSESSIEPPPAAPPIDTPAPELPTETPTSAVPTETPTSAVPTETPTSAVPTETPTEREHILERGRRWVAEADFRIVRRFWVLEEETLRAMCPRCQPVMRGADPQGTLAMKRSPAEAQEAMRAGASAVLASHRPIEPGEVWYAACYDCLAEGPEALAERIDRLLVAALAEEDA